MSTKLICLVSSVLVLSLAGNASADLAGHWKLDEGSGKTASDATGNGHDGTLEGNPQWVVGYFGGALQFAGSPDRVVVPYDPQLNPEEAFTVSVWANVAPGSSGWRSPITSRDDYPQRGYIIYAGDNGNWQFWIGSAAGGWSNAAGPPIQHGEWTHVAATYSPGAQKLYINGELAGEAAGTMALNTDKYLSIGAGRTDMPAGDYFYAGMIDDVRLYDHVLTEDEIASSMENQGGAIVKAYGPSPKDGALHADTWVTLGWKTGDLAASHDVYLGDNFDDLDSATRDSETFRGNQTSTFYVAGFPGYAYPDGLVPGTTYYWRIDEVNDAEPNSPWKGDIWRFSIPPKTAYNPRPGDGAEFVALDSKLSWTAGFGAKLHTVYFGDDFDTVSNATGGLPQGLASYTPSALQAEKVYYWRVDEFDALATYKGDVWAFTTPGAAGAPQPANGATGVQMVAKLSWTPATTAASHDVYFGTDKAAVRTATKASPEFKGNKAAGAENHDPGKLAWHSDYYWRVDAVYSTGTVKGLVWSFTTADFLLVDDFESYNDIDPPDPASNRIFDAWIDGFADPATNGALVGNDLPPYAEQTIVHGGAQSMPYRYDNANKTSEATLTLVYPRDWTEEGVGQLSLWFRGASANSAERMYVALNGGTPVYHTDAKVTQTGRWTRWVIDLQAFQGVTLTNVNTITLGLGTKGSPAAGGAGKMYFDDIRLYRP